MQDIEIDRAVYLGLLAKIKANQPLDDSDRIAFSCLVQSHPEWVTDPPRPEKEIEYVASDPVIQYLEIEKPIACTLQVWGSVVYLVLWEGGS